MLRFINSFVSIILLTSLVIPAAVTAETPEVSLIPALVFSEVKVNHDTLNAADIDEFIELYNPTTEVVDLSRYEIHYFNNLTPTIVVPTKKIQPLLSGLLLPGQHIVLAEDQLHESIADGALIADLLTSGLRNDFGRLHLIETGTGNVVDTVAWASTTQMADAYALATESPVITVCGTCATDKVKSLNRSAEDYRLYRLLEAEWELGAPTPGDFSPYTIPPVEEEEPVTPDVVVPPLVAPPELTCEGIILSELLPNPAGVDTESEFIELYNPTQDIINLARCAIQTSGSTKQFQLSGSMGPGVHKVLDAAASGLTLPNSAGGTVWLLSPTEEIDTATYPGSLEDDASWSFASNTWQISYVITKGTLNIIASVRPCPAGQIRGSDTDRCQVPVIAVVASLTPCRAGQERNLETNRCRTVASLTSSSLTPCREGQERNPETNRCRAVLADGELAECAEGHERNAETNRCRKVTTAGTTLAAVTDVPSPVKASSQKWLIAGVMLAAVIGYAVYEWRQDILLQGRSLLGKMGLKK